MPYQVEKELKIPISDICYCYKQPYLTHSIVTEVKLFYGTNHIKIFYVIRLIWKIYYKASLG